MRQLTPTGSVGVGRNNPTSDTLSSIAECPCGRNSLSNIPAPSHPVHIPPKNLSAASHFLLTTPPSEFYLFQTGQLQDLNLRTQSLVEQSESQEGKQREILSEMCSSGNSILA